MIIPFAVATCVSVASSAAESGEFPVAFGTPLSLLERSAALLLNSFSRFHRPFASSYRPRTGVAGAFERAPRTSQIIGIGRELVSTGQAFLDEGAVGHFVLPLSSDEGGVQRYLFLLSRGFVRRMPGCLGNSW